MNRFQPVEVSSDLLRNIVGARKKHPMYKLTLLSLDLKLLDYPDNPAIDTLPCIHAKLQDIVSPVQSYGTMLASINNLEAYAKPILGADGHPVIVIITPMPVPLPI